MVSLRLTCTKAWSFGTWGNFGSVGGRNSSSGTFLPPVRCVSFYRGRITDILVKDQDQLLANTENSKSKTGNRYLNEVYFTPSKFNHPQIQYPCQTETLYKRKQNVIFHPLRHSYTNLNLLPLLQPYQFFIFGSTKVI